MAVILRNQGSERRLCRGCSRADSSFILFAGFPLKRVAAIGNRPPRDQRRNLFYVVSRFIGNGEKSTPGTVCPVQLFWRRRKTAFAAAHPLAGSLKKPAGKIHRGIFFRRA